MATISWADIGSIVGAEALGFIGILEPFLPALARVSVEVYAGFIEHLGKGQFEDMTQLMYQHMTVQERETLESVVYQNALEATQARYERDETLKQIGLQIAIGLLVRVATGGIL